jgi:hypothetical protein
MISKARAYVQGCKSEKRIHRDLLPHCRPYSADKADFLCRLIQLSDCDFCLCNPVAPMRGLHRPLRSVSSKAVAPQKRWQ